MTQLTLVAEREAEVINLAAYRARKPKPKPPTGPGTPINRKAAA